MEALSIFSDVKNALTAWKVWGQLKEAGVKGRLLAVVVGIAGAVATAVVARLTTACPDLFANFGAVATAGLGGAWAFVRAKENWGTSLILGAGAAGLAAMSVQIRLMCGADFFTVAPTVAMAGLWVGIMAYLKAPKV